MKIHMACGFPIRENEEKVLKVLLEADDWPSLEELVEKTGLHPAQVRRAVYIIRHQMGMARTREHLRGFLDG